MGACHLLARETMTVGDGAVFYSLAIDIVVGPEQNNVRHGPNLGAWLIYYHRVSQADTRALYTQIETHVWSSLDLPYVPRCGLAAAYRRVT